MEDLKKQFPLGTKVVPHSKSIGDSQEKAVVWKRAKKNNLNFLYVNGYYADALVLYDKENPGFGGDYYLPSDVTLYTDEPNYQIF